MGKKTRRKNQRRKNQQEVRQKFFFFKRGPALQFTQRSQNREANELLRGRESCNTIRLTQRWERKQEEKTNEEKNQQEVRQNYFFSREGQLSNSLRDLRIERRTSSSEGFTTYAHKSVPCNQRKISHESGSRSPLSPLLSFIMSSELILHRRIGSPTTVDAWK